MNAIKKIDAEILKEIVLMDSTLVISNEVAASVGYEAVRYNAIKHGILSSLTVLAS
jgi:hypothetical protein